MQILSNTIDTETVDGNGNATIQFLFDQLPVGNSFCIAIVNLGKATIQCTAVKKYPDGLGTVAAPNDYSLDIAEYLEIGLLQPTGQPGDRHYFYEQSMPYKAVQYVFTGGAPGSQIRGTVSIGAPR
jgi:hypothetical protein